MLCAAPSRNSSRLALCVLLALAACGGTEPGFRDQSGPEWYYLARGFHPEPSVPASGVRRWEAPAWGGPPLLLERAAEDGAVWVEASYGRQDWRPVGSRLWSAPRPMPGLEKEFTAERSRLTSESMSFDLLSTKNWSNFFLSIGEEGLDEGELAILDERAPNPSFAVSGAVLYLILPPDAVPPEQLSLAELVSLGYERDGAWRVPIGGLVAEGLPVLVGSAEQVRTDVPPDATLHFATLALGAPPRSGTAPEVVFRVLLDGEVVHEHTQTVAASLETQQHAVHLGARHKRGATVTFEVEGPACWTAFLNPIIGPSQVGERGARPWGTGPRDVVLFLADTFRADNLAVWGGDPELTPRLNALAAQSRRFLEARAAACWTLPSHAALFSGMYPHQSGIAGQGGKLPSEAATLAECFRAAGYRTVAITESAFVSRVFGLDQGFDWFEERDMLAHGIERTLASAREQLALDDGRPLFLFVHTYRTHIPYVVSDATRRRLGDRYDFSGDSMDLLRRHSELPKLEPDGKPADGERAGVMAELESLYRGGVADLDQAFGSFLADLEGAADLEQAVLAFTSDHGEAFGEHGQLFHMRSIWDEVARVPLLLRAPGLTPGDETDPVGLVDLAPTLCRLAGVEPSPQWIGRDLLSAEPVPVLTYQCLRKNSLMAIVQGDWKLVLQDRTDGRGMPPLEFAYNLSLDPSERIDHSTERGVRRLLRNLRPRLSTLRAPLLGHEEMQIPPDLEAQLKALGYLGGEDE